MAVRTSIKKTNDSNFLTKFESAMGQPIASDKRKNFLPLPSSLVSRPFSGDGRNPHRESASFAGLAWAVARGPGAYGGPERVSLPEAADSAGLANTAPVSAQVTLTVQRAWRIGSIAPSMRKGETRLMCHRHYDLDVVI